MPEGRRSWWRPSPAWSRPCATSIAPTASRSTRSPSGASAGDYDAVVLPGGVANPDALRTDAAAVDFLMAMFEAGKPVAAICHGPWTLIEGDLVAGRTLTSWPSLQTDLRNAGAYWVDREVVVCRLGINTMVTSRKPEDLGAFCREMVAAFAPAGVLV